MRIWKINSAILIMIAVLLAACEGASNVIMDLPPATPEEAPPFVITRPVFEINSRLNYFNYAGLVFYFLNSSQENVDGITLSFMLFDAETQASPFFGSNKFEITKYVLVLPNENKEVIISLDSIIYIAPEKPYLIDFFYISEIHYTDGGVWQDKYGKYRVRW